MNILLLMPTMSSGYKYKVRISSKIVKVTDYLRLIICLLLNKPDVNIKKYLIRGSFSYYHKKLI